MTTIEEFLQNINHLDIKLWVENDRLCYRGSKDKLTPEILAELKARKPELLTFLPNYQTLITQIKPVSRAEILPLSFAQERLWFLDKLEENQTIYNLSSVLHLEGNLNILALKKAFFTIIKRHENFRTCFQDKNGIPYQVISPKIDFKIPVIDLTSLSLNEQNQEVEKIAKEEANTPFDLSKMPLIRVKIFKLSLTIHILIITIHHIIYDGWSHNILRKELSTLYSAYIQNELNPLPDLSIQYADFAFWQKQYLQGEVLNEHINYWQNQFKNVPFLLELPLDFSRPAQQSYQGKSIKIKIDKSLTNQLKQLSRKLNVTLFMIFLSAFSVLLYRYSQQKDIIIGTPIANRTLTEMENLIGFFANTLALKISCENDLTFRELLQQVKMTTLAAYTYQKIPFEKLVELLKIERSLSYNPLFQIMFSWQNMPKENLTLGDIIIKPLKFENNITQFDLDLTLTENDEDINGYIKYNTALFKLERILRMVEHFQVLLQAIVDNPDQKISQLPLLTETEKKQLLVEFNPPENQPNINKCIHELFEEQVTKTPQKIAVNIQQEKLTYQELNEKANQLAHYLQELGIKQKALIGIYIEKSLSMIIGLLAILKVGATYLPLDINYPKERLAFMLEDAQISLLLTQTNLLNKLPSINGKILCLDKLEETLKKQPLNNFNINNIPDNLAYVIYTSGSTGKPKGVMISHSALVAFTTTAIKEYSIKKEDKILQFASLSFDTAAEEIYPCLCSGATLILRTDEWLTSIPRFLDYCQKFEISILDLPTAFWHQMIADLRDNNWHFPACLRLIIIGGEKAQKEYVKIWQKKVSNYPELINTYGPTETTIVATKYVLNSHNIDGKLPLGKPFSYVSTYVLDNYLQIVPIGIEGELYLGGKGLAKGYLNQPELTAEKFIINPFNSQTKLYKTGDKVRYLDDGNLEFIGRIDNQIKIRGFRMELGEIENIIMQYPHIKQTLVTAYNQKNYDNFLVAYIVVKNNPINCENLKHFLKEKLPLYMLPSLFIKLDYLPLTSNGKIDYNKLPKPDFNEVYQSTNFVAPRNDLEEKLADIWLEILTLNKVSIKDNFFTLGGHSLLAIKLMSEIERKFNVNLPLSLIFKAGNIEDLAQEISNLKTQEKIENNYSSLILMKQGNSNLNPLFLVHPIGGEIFCYNDLVSSLNSQRSCYGLTYPNYQNFYQSIEDLALNHLTEIKKVQSEGKYLLGGWSFGGLITFEMAQQLNQQGKNIDLLILIEPTIPSQSNKIDDHLLLIDFITNLTFNKPLNINWQELKFLSITEQLNIILTQLKEKDILPQNYRVSKFQQKFDIFKYHVQAISNYKVSDLNANILFFKSSNYPAIAVNFWQQKVKGNFTVYEVPGNHFMMMFLPNIKLIIPKIFSAINES